ncbi:FAD-dependent oxidoreductase [Ochrobactrum oryzae]|nr:FAD-dependent oxidoreductase [Brucella oryzae]
MQAIGRFIPALKDAEIIRVWSGVEAYLPDMLPIVGASETTPGLYHAFGGSGGGFQIGPAVGLCLTNMILGYENQVSIEPYSISRFRSTIKASDKLRSEFDNVPPVGEHRAGKQPDMDGNETGSEQTVCVIGGGLLGLFSALTLQEQRKQVHLIEREEVGGRQGASLGMAAGSIRARSCQFQYRACGVKFRVI